MKKILFSTILACAATLPVAAQRDFTDFNNNEDSQFRPQTGNRINTDSLGTDKEIPKGIRVWTVDERFGDTRAAVVDTMQAMYQNTTFTEGLRGEYNTLGNMASPASTASSSTDATRRATSSSPSHTTTSLPR